MEKDMPMGTIGDVDFKFEAGKASIQVKAALPVAGVTAGAMIEMDAMILIDKVFAAIEAKSPVGVVVIEEGVKLIVKNAVAAIK